MNFKNIFITIFSICLVLSPVLPVFGEDFDPNYIVTDTEMNDYTSMDLEDVESFLEQKGGFISNYFCEDIEGAVRKAPEIIYTLSQENKLNPKFMLTLLQKEQSLVEDPSPSSGQLNAATGYGCPDGSGCNSRWKGFFRQVNSAYLQFRSYLDEGHLYRYKTGETYVFNNSNKNQKTIDIVTPKNQATAALYNYTPHVYYGNYNFWKLWNKYFPTQNTFFPDGSLLREKGQPGIFLIQNGEKRPFLSKSALLSRFSLNKVVDVEAIDLQAYSTGKPIKFPNYSLLRTPKEIIYLLVGDTLREIESDKVFSKIGFSRDEIIDIEQDELNDYNAGKLITETDIYPTGALLQDTSSGGIYFVIDNTRYPIWHKQIMEINFPKKKIIPTPKEELEKYAKAGPLKLREGELIKSILDPKVFVISNGQKRPIASEETFLTLGYKWSDIIDVNGRVLEIHPTGEELNIDTKEGKVVVAGM
ncbi:hypothetical protein HOD96_00460 [Candidatus Falkowbacteria bacterium]|jgi:hypothetical protein|nr:hypothetical protein [Candidatus Falkowbacteria bacterium]MBT4433290.1 hypothetical protein [Candidatus Falkowbacteria bacterium]